MDNKESARNIFISSSIGLISIIIVALVSYILGARHSSNDYILKNESVNQADFILSKMMVTVVPPNDEKTLLDTVKRFYDYISARQIKLAYETLSRDYKKNVGAYEIFLKGFKTTLNVNLQDVKIDDSDINSVYVKIVATDLIGDKVIYKSFDGILILKFEDGEWKLNSSNIKELSDLRID